MGRTPSATLYTVNALRKAKFDSPTAPPHVARGKEPLMPNHIYKTGLGAGQLRAGVTRPQRAGAVAAAAPPPENGAPRPGLKAEALQQLQNEKYSPEARQQRPAAPKPAGANPAVQHGNGPPRKPRQTGGRGKAPAPGYRGLPRPGVAAYQSPLYRFVRVLNSAVLVLLCAGVAVVSAMQVFGAAPTVPRSRDVAPYVGLLSEEEQMQWAQREVASGEAIMDINLRMPVENGRAHMRLVNPPYSDFVCEVTLHLKTGADGAENEPLYHSERLNPGSAVEYAELAAPLAPGEHTAVAQYTFYDGTGSVKGQYEVEVVLIQP